MPSNTNAELGDTDEEDDDNATSRNEEIESLCDMINPVRNFPPEMDAFTNLP